MSLPSTSRASAPAEPDDYLDRRRLRRGSAGWLLPTGLGVACVVCGDYSGWNFGLAEGGFGGLAIAMVLRGTMYACGVLTSSVALVLACAALVATFLVDVTAAFIALAVYIVAVAYFGLYSRRHLVAKAPEEEFAALAAAEAELSRD